MRVKVTPLQAQPCLALLRNVGPGVLWDSPLSHGLREGLVPIPVRAVAWGWQPWKGRSCWEGGAGGAGLKKWKRMQMWIFSSVS